MLRKLSTHAAIIVSMLVICLCSAGPSNAATLASTDFGTTEGTNISPFSTDYLPMSGATWPDHYYVATSGGGHFFSSFDWGGVDHTTGTGCFMVVDGAMDASHAVVSYTVNAVAGQQYTFDGWVQDIISGNWGPPVLSFRVNGVQQDTFSFSNQRTWNEFTFTYTAVTAGNTTFALHDNNTALGMNDFGLDDLKLTGPNPVPLPSTVLLLSSGLLGLAGLRRRLKKS